MVILSKSGCKPIEDSHLLNSIVTIMPPWPLRISRINQYMEEESNVHGERTRVPMALDLLHHSQPLSSIRHQLYVHLSPVILSLITDIQAAAYSSYGGYYGGQYPQYGQAQAAQPPASATDSSGWDPAAAAAYYQTQGWGGYYCTSSYLTVLGQS
jgi:hypothetical protein